MRDYHYRTYLSEEKNNLLKRVEKRKKEIRNQLIRGWNEEPIGINFPSNLLYQRAKGILNIGEGIDFKEGEFRKGVECLALGDYLVLKAVNEPEKEKKEGSYKVWILEDEITGWDVLAISHFENGKRKFLQEFDINEFSKMQKKSKIGIYEGCPK